MVSTLTRDSATATPRLRSVGVVTCVAIETPGLDPAIGDRLEDTFAREGASAIVATDLGFIGAFRRVTDAVRATLVLRTQFPSSRIALGAGETGAHGEFGSIADKAMGLVARADPGCTLLSKLTGVLALDHLPRDQSLLVRSGTTLGEPGCYELLDAAESLANSA